MRMDVNKWVGRFAWVIWFLERMYEKSWAGCAVPQSTGLNCLDGAMVLASWRGKPGKLPRMVKILIEAGADPAAREHHAFNAAIVADDGELLAWMFRRKRPPDEALAQAKAWARHYKQDAMIALLGRLLAEELANELSAQATYGSAAKSAMRL